ncbi:MAG: hypothetical protein ACJZ45_02345 [Nitrospinia bacterium]
MRSKNNPPGPETGESKVVRGGSFDSSAGHCGSLIEFGYIQKIKFFLK